MGKVTLLVPREDMLYQAHNILQEKKYHIDDMKVISSESAVTEAKEAIARGAEIIIARGLQAFLIKQYTDIPVVEIVMTAQEMALLVMRAKKLIEKPRPVIAVVGFRNMFCDMSYFDELYEIHLRTYLAKREIDLKSEKDLKDLAAQAVIEGADLIIGGDTAVSEATRLGLPSLFLSTTEDSLKNAFETAERMEYAMNAEKKSAAQMEALLDYTYSGIIQVDGSGKVTAVNPLMADILGKEKQELVGKPLEALSPEFHAEVTNPVLSEGKEASMFLELSDQPLLVTLVPVLLNGRVDGAVITCHKMSRKAVGRRETKIAGKAKGPFALGRLEDICRRSPAMKECVRLAGLFAMSGQPITILGESGTELRLLAEGIHNASSHRQEPFLDVSCAGMPGQEQKELIFGPKGAAIQAWGGTLMLRDVAGLTEDNQYLLYQLIRFHICGNYHMGDQEKLQVQIIVTVKEPLKRLAARGEILEELYYLLAGMELRIPPLSERPEDLEEKLRDAIRAGCERYSRFHVLTAGAKKVLMEYPWPGNLVQVENFCNRLILTAQKRSLDEITVKKLLLELYGDEPKDNHIYENEEKRLIQEALEQFRGNRGKAAEKLGISKSTLWRRMKEYKIE